jgi:serine/threonine protein kinase
MPGLEGTALSHYRLQRRLGRGGMSEVYLATDETTQEDIAIKLVNSSHAEYTERFLHEIETMRTLTHKHILPILDSGEHGPWHYLVIPYIRQGTLHGRLRRGRLNFQATGEILEQVASALQFAHDHGIIHRDIKPSNILLASEWFVYLADFGLAKAIEDDYGITQTNCLMGTPEYLAPELMDGAASTRSDIYALGILLYEMVAGRVPFKASTPVGVCWKHLHEQPTPPSQLNPAISHATELVILCALEKDPHRRFESAKALVQAYQESFAVRRGVMNHARTERSAEGKAEEACILAQSASFPVLKINKLAFAGGGKHMPLRGQKTMPKQLSRRDVSLPPTTRMQRILVVFTVFIFLLTTSLSLGLFAASNGLHTHFSAIAETTDLSVNRSRIQQKLIPPTFNLSLHHLEGNLTSPFIPVDRPRAKKPHHRGNADNGNPVWIGNDPNTNKDFEIGKGPRTRPGGNYPLPGNGNNHERDKGHGGGDEGDND